MNEDITINNIKMPYIYKALNFKEKQITQEQKTNDQAYSEQISTIKLTEERNTVSQATSY